MENLRRLFSNNRALVEDITRSDPDFFRRSAGKQEPHFLFIGCADSRVPLETLTGAAPGEMFVHRNIANQVMPADLNLLSVLQYAVDVLDVPHVIVCGHYQCGGVHAAMTDHSYGVVDYWLSGIREDPATAPAGAGRAPRRGASLHAGRRAQRAAAGLQPVLHAGRPASLEARPTPDAARRGVRHPRRPAAGAGPRGVQHRRGTCPPRGGARRRRILSPDTNRSAGDAEPRGSGRDRRPARHPRRGDPGLHGGGVDPPHPGRLRRHRALRAGRSLRPRRGPRSPAHQRHLPQRLRHLGGADRRPLPGGIAAALRAARRVERARAAPSAGGGQLAARRHPGGGGRRSRAPAARRAHRAARASSRWRGTFGAACRSTA